MEARAASVLDIFEKKMQIQVPLFQRQYVWTLERQWAPLWEDIERKFREQLDGRVDAPVHFLGAMVLDQKQTGTIDIDRRQIIDGQQRLTTLQIVLAAFRDLCKVLGVHDVQAEVSKYVMNDGILPNPETDRFKIWPTQLDQPQFRDAITAGSPEALVQLHPYIHRKYSRKFEPRPIMVESYEYFYAVLRGFFEEAEIEGLGGATQRDRLLKCLGALKNTLRIVAIDLQHDDDPQVIFETLNARGVPLLPADLLRNYIFLRAARDRAQDATLAPMENLYAQYWKSFDDPFWRQEERQGRYRSARSDLFMQHFVSSRTAEDVSVKHLFVEYKNWIETKRPFANVTDELVSLADNRARFARLIAPTQSDVLYTFASFVKAFDISTVFPLLLFILEARPDDGDIAQYIAVLESYLLRRAICDLTAKNYNRFFLSAIREMQRNGTNPNTLSDFLSRQTSDTSLWPDDVLFGEAWLGNHAYRTLSNPRLVYILSKINTSYRTNKTENLDGLQMTVEHLMPQAWQEHWPLPSGATGLDHHELVDAAENDPVARETRERNAALQTLGNLTIITQPLNSSVSNGPWTQKRDDILMHSMLPINQQLRNTVTWDESRIRERSERLLQCAVKLWPWG